MEFEFEAELWRWESRAELWTFVSVPADFSEQIAEVAQTMPRAGFGAVKVRVGVGARTWSTSIFPGGDGRYSLPIKKAVRDAAKAGLGDSLRVRLETVEF